MAFDFSALVTDRTQADVAACNSKGTYNAADLNRVNACIDYLVTKFRAAGYALLNYQSIQPAPVLTPITVKATDETGYLTLMLTDKGVLTVGDAKIVDAETPLSLASPVEVKYQMTGSLAKARSVTVNGILLGAVSNPGDEVSTYVDIQSGDIITIVFKQA